MKLISLIIMLLMTFCVSCEKDKSGLGFEPGPPGSFSYQAYDTLGNLLVGGWLSFERTDSMQIEGSWHIVNLSNRSDIEHIEGEGVLSGSIINSSIKMELTRKVIDSFLRLEGIMRDDSFDGKWKRMSLSSHIDWGTFKASKN